MWVFFLHGGLVVVTRLGLCCALGVLGLPQQVAACGTGLRAESPPREPHTLHQRGAGNGAKQQENARSINW